MNNALIRQAEEHYFYILQQVALAADVDSIEVYLTEAFELGRVMVDQQVPSCELINIHHEAIVRLSQLHPMLTFAQVASRLSKPLMKMSMAYGMAFREQMQQRYHAMVNARLEQSYTLDAVGRLTAGIASDFNNLLGSIIGFAEQAGGAVLEGCFAHGTLAVMQDLAAMPNLTVMQNKLNSLLATEQGLQEKVALNERHFRMLVESSPNIIVRYNQDCSRVFVNPAFTRETGFSAEQVLGKSVNDTNVWLPGMPTEDYCKRLQQVMATGVPEIVQLEWMRPNKCFVSHEMYVVAEYDAAARVIGTLAIGRDVTDRKAAEQQLLHQTSYDTLSGLPNRRLFVNCLYDEIVRAGRGNYRLAVLFINLDHFKNVNDTLGHSVGDQLLTNVAQRIRKCLRESDTVARLAGDEFVAIFPKQCELISIERLAQSITTSLTQPFHLAEHKVYISASIGVAIYPDDADNTESLIACAEQAMFVSKAAGHNSVSFFTRSMQEQVLRRKQLLNDLRDALKKGQFEVHYQPIVDLDSSHIIKAEALVRWRHPELGMVSPDQFIPLAEETELIHELGAWVLQEAVKTAIRWNEQAGAECCRQISVNLSPVQFIKGQCDRMVIDTLHAFGLEPEKIAVEITEGLLLEDSQSVINQLQMLRSAGIQIAIDDFGTGYSAMSYLKKFNIDYLKIDRSFISDLETNPGDQAIAEAIVVMAHRLGLKVIAEGVETIGQLALLAQVNCEYVQGYLYSRPLATEAFLEFVATSNMPAPILLEANSGF